MASDDNVSEKRRDDVAAGAKHEEDVHTAAERGLAATDRSVSPVPPTDIESMLTYSQIWTFACTYR